SFLGVVGSWAVPLTLFVWGWNRLRVKAALETALRTALGAIGLFLLLGFLQLITSGNRALSGGAGETVALFASRLLGKIGGELILGTALVVVGVVAFEVGSSQLARQALQRALGVMLAPFRKRAGVPDAAPASATPATARGRKSAALEEAQIASAWDAESMKGREPAPPPP